ncbi:MAG: CAP domain-containing protein [Actinomycetota bacterium]
MGRSAVRPLVAGLVVAGVWFSSFGVASALSDDEACFVAKINAERQGAGLRSMAVNDQLVSNARVHTQEMADAGTIYHTTVDAMKALAPSNWLSLGENVGMGRTCDTLHAAFMASEGHRRNVMDASFNNIGVGVVIASDGTMFVTESFMQAQSTTSASPAPTPTTTTTTTSAPASTPSTGTTSTSTASAPKPKATATSKPATAAQPVAAADPAPAEPVSPPPPPPPPPGSKVTGRTASYFGMLEVAEVAVSPEERAALLASKAIQLRPRTVAAAPRGFFARVASLVRRVVAKVL